MKISNVLNMQIHFRRYTSLSDYRFFRSVRISCTTLTISQLLPKDMGVGPPGFEVDREVHEEQGPGDSRILF